MELWQLALLSGVGFVAGLLNVIAGGGSLLTLPVMVFLGLEGPVANGTNRVAILIQNISAIGGFFRQGFSDFKLSLSLSLCAVPGALAGAYFGTELEGEWFNRTLAGIMVGVLLLMVARARHQTPPPNAAPDGKPRRLVLGHILMVGAGFYGGFIQAGIGFIMMAILHTVMGLDLVRVNMHKVFIVEVYTIIALAVFAWNGQVFWGAGLALAAGNAAGGWIATLLAVRKGDRFIRAILYIALIAMAIQLLVR